MLKTADDIIEALGGPTKAGRALGVKTGTVSQWRLRSYVPPEMWFRIVAALGEEPAKEPFRFAPPLKRRG